MSRELSRARIGAFVLFSFASLIALLLWLGSRRVFADRDYYVTYFTESVSGLEVSAPVKFRGVVVGKVADISIDPEDSSRIRVLLDVRRGTPLKKDMAAQMGTTGITGIKYIELVGGASKAERLPPGTPEAPVEIPARRTLFAKVEQQVDELLTELTATVGNLRSLTNEQQQNRFAETLDGIEELSHSLAAAIDALRPSLGRIDVLGTETEALLGATRGQIEAVGREAQQGLRDLADVVRTSPLRETLARLDGVSRNLLALSADLRDDMGVLRLGELGEEVRLTLADIRRAARSVEVLARKLERNPSSLVFGRPPGPKTGTAVQEAGR